ncbi:MAG: hypothetical protein GXP35_17230 [Actinobacteria bacterium]|nr:hypothetical protein [Actinomycetota bacterium]
MSDVECPQCSETEDLSGTTTNDGIQISCHACNTTWMRDLDPRCDRCNGKDVEAAVKAIVEKSRGSQLSIVATQTVYLCRSCDDKVLARYRVSRSPLMPDQLPTS